MLLEVCVGWICSFQKHQFFVSQTTAFVSSSATQLLATDLLEEFLLLEVSSSFFQLKLAESVLSHSNLRHSK